MEKYLSRIKYFYKLTRHEKYKALIKKITSKERLFLFSYKKKINNNIANFMIENNIDVFYIPIGICLNFIVNHKPIIIPFVIEEASVVAASSFSGNIIGKAGGFYAKTSSPVMIGQMHILKDFNIYKTKIILDINKHRLINIINKTFVRFFSRNGGCINIVTKIIHCKKNIIHFQYDDISSFLLVYFYINCGDTMGANIINTILESVTLTIKHLLNTLYGMRILSNFSTKRISKTFCRVPYYLLHIQNNHYLGFKIAQQMISAYRLSIRDQYRACTHNKGIMNGIDALAIASGNDWRAIEAGVHAYAAKESTYSSLTMYYLHNGCLMCYLEIPLAIGIFGGSTQSNPFISIMHNLLGLTSLRTNLLSNVISSVGLAQNFAAMKSLISTGIQQGHMFLHSKQIGLALSNNALITEFLIYNLIKSAQINKAKALYILNKLNKKILVKNKKI